MTDYAPPLSEQAAAILDSITADQAEQLRLQLLAASAQGEGVDAVCDFGELVFGVVAAKHHRDWISAMLTAPDTGLSGPRVSVTAPPESAKTTWGTIIKTAWYIGKNPLLAYGIVSAGEQAADDMAKAVANTIEYNPRWRLVFPHVGPDKQRGWSSDGYHVRRNDLAEGEWERQRYGDKNPSLISGGVGSARWNGWRGTGGLTWDDGHDRKSKTEIKTCLDVVGFFKDTAEYRVTGKGFLHILQTRWAAKDVVAEVKLRPDFVIFECPAIQVINDEEVSYWPAHHPLAKLQAIRARSPIDFELQFQGNEKAVEGAVLKVEWLHGLPLLDFRKEWPHYFGVDFAQKLRDVVTKNNDPDRFVLSVWDDAGGRLVVNDVFAEVLYMSDAEDLFFSKADFYQPRNSGVETNGAAAKTYYLNLLKRMSVTGRRYLITPVMRTADKGTYYAAMAPYFASGQCLVSEAQTPGLMLFRQEWAMWPQGHDDCLDGVYNGWHILSHFMPSESLPARQEREKRAANYVTPAQMINRAYR